MMKLAALLLALVVAACAFPPPEARGHESWISELKLKDPESREWCCDETDTFEESANIEAVPGGFKVLSTGEFIPLRRVIWRSPAGWWRSRKPDGTTRCLIGPEPRGT